jgi:lipopolysaccharide/colanic/teichoic acid biosynthesis glycosyltransferase
MIKFTNNWAKMKAKSKYINSWQKRLFDLIVSAILLVVLSPIIMLISLLILSLSGWPILFFQKRVGRNSKIFTIYKFRTMYVGADVDQKKFQHLNQADGPVFKIRNDPRFIGIGKWLSNTGLDELPQVINVIKGDMSIVGPRPLPPNEDKKIEKSIRDWRKKIRPGIMSDWITSGHHNSSFSNWLTLDRSYYHNATIKHDIVTLMRVFQQQALHVLKHQY